jgi:hypothetical protein
LLQRAVRTIGIRKSILALAATSLLHCGVAPDDHSAVRRQAILGGSTLDAQDSPVLLLNGPEGQCTAALAAPNLAVTVRHCVAHNGAGAFACTAAGDVIPNGTGAGQIGANDTPSSLHFFTWGSVQALAVPSDSPDAVGKQIISTNSLTSCRDDLAFVILDRPITKVAPLSLRIDALTYPGEAITVAGYGFTDHNEATALRTVDNAAILAVGPDTPPSIAQPAPVRSVKIGPYTCVGDSGGPLIGADGTVIAVVSIGSQVVPGSLTCPQDAAAAADTTGPRLGAYKPLVSLAFNTAYAALYGDAGPEAEASVDAPDETTSTDDASIPPVDDGAAGAPPESPPADDSGCAVARVGSLQVQSWTWIAGAVALAAAAMGRRRRNGSSS